MKLVGSFTLIAVKDPEPAESYTLKMDGTVHLDGYNAQQGEALFYVEHKAGSDTGRAPAYYTVRFLTASHEAGELTFGSDGSPLETLGFTYPADKYGYANTLKVEAYSDPQRSRLMAEGSFPIVRDNPVYKARGEVWDKGLVYRNGEFTLLDDKVYMWDYPVAGNSTLRPDLDRAQDPQFEGGVPYKVDDKTHWTLYEEWEVLATKVLFSQFALLGGAVMDGKMNAQGKYGYAKMYSQTGQDGTTDYQKFDASKDAWDNTQEWKPNLCLDFLKGTMYGKQGRFEGEVKGVRGSFQTLAGTFNETEDGTHKVGDPEDGSPYLSLGSYGITASHWKDSSAGNVVSGVFNFQGDFYSQGASNDYIGGSLQTFSRSWRYYASDILCRGLFGFYRLFPVLVKQNFDSGETYAEYLTGGTDTGKGFLGQAGLDEVVRLQCPMVGGQPMIKLYSPVNYTGGDYYKPGDYPPLTTGVTYNMVIIYAARKDAGFELEDLPAGALAIVVNRSGNDVGIRSGDGWIHVINGNCLVFAKVMSHSIGDTYATGPSYKGDGWYCINRVNDY